MSEPSAARPLWHGRLGDSPAEELLAFTESLSVDRRLASEDLAGSRAHVRMLGAAGIITPDEVDQILGALATVESEPEDGSFAFAPTDEDIHTAVERRVTELAGGAGAKLHTGRSRNDQVATDLRLYVLRAGAELAGAIDDLQATLLDRAIEAGDRYLPGYTHLQRAQPVLLAHHLLAHFWALARDVERWRDALPRASVSPLGAGALAGSSLPLDPDAVAQDLGFQRRFENSLDAVSDRDFAAEALFVATLTMVHLSRLGEELVLWSGAEFGFATFADEYATGSSMLPQKKNPDVAELVRGKTGRVIGDLTGLLATLKGLPLSYNRDLQEDKEPLFDALDTCGLALRALRGVIATVIFHDEAMRAAADEPASAATDLAEHLVAAGVPFRDAHTAVGALVRQAEEQGLPLSDVAARDPQFAGASDLLEPGRAVRRRTTPGGGGPEPLRAQLDAARTQLAEQRAWLHA